MNKNQKKITNGKKGLSSDKHMAPLHHDIIGDESDTVNFCTGLRLVAKSSKNGSKISSSSTECENDVLRSEVFVHPLDAQLVDIRDGEPAMIIRNVSTDATKAAEYVGFLSAVCIVRLSVVSLSSKPVKFSKKVKEVAIPRGKMHVSKSWLIDYFSLETKQRKMTTSPPKISIHQSLSIDSKLIKDAPEITTPTCTPKSSFSFATRSGNDALISSPQIRSISSPLHKSDESIELPDTEDVTIIPSNDLLIPLNNIRKQHRWSLFPNARELLLIPLRSLQDECNTVDSRQKSTQSSEIDQSSLFTSNKVIQTLIVAKYDGSFVNIPRTKNHSKPYSTSDDRNTSFHLMEVLTVSFRGQLESFFIVDVIPELIVSNWSKNISVTFSDQDNELPQCFHELTLSVDSTDKQLIHDIVDSQTSNQELFQNFLRSYLEERTTNDDVNRRNYVACKITPHTQIRFTRSSDACQTSNEFSKSYFDATHQKLYSNPKLCAGVETTLSRIKESLLPAILQPNLFPKDGPLRPPKGVLLYGPSGVGKSLIAAQIAQDLSMKSISSINTNIHVRMVQCSDILASTSIVGEAENTLSKIFEEAERGTIDSNGSLVILDDVHLICPRRGGMDVDSRGIGVDQLAGTLLSLVDGLGSLIIHGATKDKLQSSQRCKGVVVILAITTDPSLLDPALRRSGRLDFEIEVSVPDDKTRAEILYFHISQLMRQQSVKNDQKDESQLIDKILEPCITRKDIETLACLGKGFTGADCKLAVKEALRISISRKLSQLENSKNSHSFDRTSVNYSDLEHAIRTIKPSAIKSISVEIPHVPWTAIGGMDNVKALLRESIEMPLSHPFLFERMKVHPPNGILLYGPPGCSKTLMARAIATEGKMNFLAVKGPELLSKWLGESERALASLFRRARLASPAVLFFDEVDAIASKRGDGGGGGGDRLLSQLLTEMDGVTSNGGGHSGSNRKSRVVVVGATNRPDVLDPSLTRPGRMDRMIYVGLPDKDGRKSIFEIGLRGKLCNKDVNVSLLASDDITKGYSGAEIIAICRDAALHAIADLDRGDIEVPELCMRHLLRSINEIKPRTTQKMLQFYKSFTELH